jgi:hypothetical protein
MSSRNSITATADGSVNCENYQRNLEIFNGCIRLPGFMRL